MFDLIRSEQDDLTKMSATTLLHVSGWIGMGTISAVGALLVPLAFFVVPMIVTGTGWPVEFVGIGYAIVVIIVSVVVSTAVKKRYWDYVMTRRADMIDERRREAAQQSES